MIVELTHRAGPASLFLNCRRQTGQSLRRSRTLVRGSQSGSFEGGSLEGRGACSAVFTVGPSIGPVDAALVGPVLATRLTLERGAGAPAYVKRFANLVLGDSCRKTISSSDTRFLRGRRALCAGVIGGASRAMMSSSDDEAAFGVVALFALLERGGRVGGDSGMTTGSSESLIAVLVSRSAAWRRSLMLLLTSTRIHESSQPRRCVT